MKLELENKIRKLSKTKQYQCQKGITLIALVITIVVLLILAGVSINALFSDNGIIARAKDAQNKINEAEKKDLEAINELNNWLEETGGIKNETGGDKPTPSAEWTQEKTKVTNGTTTYEVGDDYSYDCGVSGYTGSWKVLGAEDGKLLIMSTIDIGTLKLEGKEGYNTGISQLNEMCKQYGTNARSIKVEDINRVTGYDPNKTGDGEKFLDGEWGEYGSNVTYTASQTTNNTNELIYTGGLNNGKYEHPDGKTIGTNGVTSITETSTWYYYYPYTLTTSNTITGTCNGISTTSKAYQLIFGIYENTSTDKGNKYWLASLCVHANFGSSSFNIRYVYTSGGVISYNLWDSSGATDNPSMGVRAVVSLY